MGAERLKHFNDLPPAVAIDELIACCSAPSWAERMASGRPYCSPQDAIRQSAVIMASMTVPDLAEALAGHPRIGERADPRMSERATPREGSLRSAEWSAEEQSGVTDTDAETARALAAGNLEYEQRFGHIYLVCASGRTGPQLLAVLRRRLGNDAAAEWQVVRTELQKINEVRLRKLLAGSP